MFETGLFNCKRVLTGRCHIILTFHRVRPSGLPPDPFDTCPSLSAAMFEKILLYAKENYSIVSLHDLCNNLGANQPLAAITFDDGWKDNHDIAFPILRELAIPATIFIVTGKIGSSEPFWQQVLGKLFHYVLNRGSIEDQKRLRSMLVIDNKVPINQDLYKKTVGEWKSLTFSKIQTKLSLKGWPKENLSWGKEVFLTADEMREMACHNIEFGSHTVNHLILTKESDIAINFELAESKKNLEEITGGPVDMLSYPNGNGSEEIFNNARALGYRIGCTTRRGAIGNSCNLLKLPRVETEWDQLQDNNVGLKEYEFHWAIR